MDLIFNPKNITLSDRRKSSSFQPILQKRFSKIGETQILESINPKNNNLIEIEQKPTKRKSNIDTRKNRMKSNFKTNYPRHRLGITSLLNLLTFNKIDNPNDRRILIQSKFRESIEIPNIEEIIRCLQLQSSERNIESLLKIAYFLSDCSLTDVLIDTAHKRTSDLAKLIYEISLRVKYKFVPKNTTLFRIGDIADNFYIIVKGKIEILRPTKYEDEITAYEYFKILIDLQNRNENYVLNELIMRNNEIFPINRDDLPIFKFIIFKVLLYDYYHYHKYDKEFDEIKIINLIKECSCEKELLYNGKININIDFQQNDSDDEDKNYNEYFLSFMQKISCLLPKISPTKLKFYKYFADKEKKENIILMKNKCIVELNSKDYFGDAAFDTSSRRNATAFVPEDTHLCYLESHLYESFLKVDKKILRLSNLNFLLDSFFFQKMHLDVFESLIFKNIIYETIQQNSVLFHRNEKLKYIYFIKSGEIELSNNLNVFELYDLIKQISKYGQNEINKDPDDLVVGFKNNFSFLEKDFLNRKKMFLFNIVDKDVLGIESFVYNLPFIYDATVVSKRAILFKLEREFLEIVANKNKNIMKKIIKEGEKKLKMIFERLIESNNTQIKMIDNNFTKKLEYMNNVERNKSQNLKIFNSLKNISQNKESNTSKINKIKIDVLGKNYSLTQIKKKNTIKTYIQLSKTKNLKFNSAENLKPKKRRNLRLFLNSEKKNHKITSSNKIIFMTQNEQTTTNNNFNHTSKTNNKFYNNIKTIETKLNKKNNLVIEINKNQVELNMKQNMRKIDTDRKNDTIKNLFPYSIKTIINKDIIKAYLSKEISKKFRISPNFNKYLCNKNLKIKKSSSCFNRDFFEPT